MTNGIDEKIAVAVSSFGSNAAGGTPRRRDQMTTTVGRFGILLHTAVRSVASTVAVTVVADGAASDSEANEPVAVPLTSSRDDRRMKSSVSRSELPTYSVGQVDGQKPRRISLSDCKPSENAGDDIATGDSQLSSSAVFFRRSLKEKPRIDALEHHQRFNPKPKVGAEILDPPRIVVRSVKSRYDGLFSISGKKHRRLEQLNEDAGSVGNYIIMDTSDQQKSHRVSMAWVFDGHGPDCIDNIMSPGRLVSKTAIKAHQYSLATSLAKIIHAPMLHPSHPDYLKSSRRALFSNTFNDTQVIVQKVLPSSISKFAGSTATSILTVSDSLDPSSPVDVLCSNLGDSRAIAITFRKEVLPCQIRFRTPLPYRLVAENIFTLTAEENIRQQTEKVWFIKECLRRGYRPAAIHPEAQTHRRPLQTVMVPPTKSGFDIRSYEPFLHLSDIEVALRHATGALPENEQCSVYVLKEPYLWRLDARGKQKMTGLQVGT